MADFSLVARILADASGFKTEISNAKESLMSLSETSNKLRSIGDALTGIGKAMSIGFTAPAVAGATAVIKSFADLEQSIGGVETLFKNSAGAVIENANNAFKTAGVSANQYMQQVTSFSATLLQGLGNDTAKAAAYGDKAIVQMSDNANKMGTSIGSIQDAYQGFAKDNYTMLDNLKLGYGGTASEMARLVNESGVLNGEFQATAENVKDIPFHTLIDAIQKTQDKLGITGTTAKGASETVSGSFASMKASAQNLLAGLGNPDADIKKLMKDLEKSIDTFVKNIKRVLSTIWDNLPLSDFQKFALGVVVAGGPVLIMVGKLVGAFGGLYGWFKKLDSGGSMLSPMFAKLVGVIAGISAPVWLAIGAITALIGVFVWLYNTNEEFRKKVDEVWNGIKSVIDSVINEISSFIMEIWGGIVSWWTENQELIRTSTETVWNAILTVIQTVMTFLQPIIETGWMIITTIISTAWTVIKTIVETAINVVLGIIKFVMQLITGDWSGAWETIKSVLQTIWDGIVSVVTTLITAVWNVITGTLSNVWNFWQEIWGKIKSFLSETWENIKSAVSTAIDNVVSTIRTGWDNAWNAVKEACDNIVKGAQRAWDDLTSGVSRAVDEVKGFFDGLSNIDLFAAGQAIMDGFLNGLKSMWDSITGWVGNIASWISNNKGPISYDRRLLIPHGKAIMTGLSGGLKSGFGEVQSLVSGMAGQIAGSFDMANSAFGGDYSGLVKSSVNSTLDVELKHQAKPMELHLTLGGHSFSAFVEDITHTQELELVLGNY